jgi:hypothetical protein
MDRSGGYWCHAGGLSPVLKAGAFIEPDTVSADFGAGNGLQCLLMQKIHPPGDESPGHIKAPFGLVQ